MPKKANKKTTPAKSSKAVKGAKAPKEELKKKPLPLTEGALKDDMDEEKEPSAEGISPDALEDALDSEDSYEADMDEEKDWE